MTRAVSGFLGSTSQRARPSRSFGASSGSGGRTLGVAAVTSSPFRSYAPRSRTWVGRGCFISSITREVGISSSVSLICLRRRSASTASVLDSGSRDRNAVSRSWRSFGERCLAGSFAAATISSPTSNSGSAVEDAAVTWMVDDGLVTMISSSTVPGFAGSRGDSGSNARRRVELGFSARGRRDPGAGEAALADSVVGRLSAVAAPLSGSVVGFAPPFSRCSKRTERLSNVAAVSAFNSTRKAVESG